LQRARRRLHFWTTWALCSLEEKKVKESSPGSLSSSLPSFLPSFLRIFSSWDLQELSWCPLFLKNFAVFNLALWGRS
jgi:hypothetical protein